MPSRHDDVAAYFTANAATLERAVARHVVASHAVVEDACSIAWSKLLRRPHIRLGSDGFWWLYRVAVREVWRLTTEARRERSFDADADASRLAHVDDVAAMAERRQTLRALDELPERQARLLFLHGCGFTYEEIARMTGATYRAVDRQLRRARERLRDADEQSLAGREIQVLDRLVDGLTIRAIALDLDIGDETVRGYLLGAYRKLGVRTRVEAIATHRARRARETMR
jgi:RNA polymerase sigma factor (sigma-70 family)